MAELNIKEKYQAAAMSFYSELIEEADMSESMEEKFKQAASIP